MITKNENIFKFSFLLRLLINYKKTELDEYFAFKQEFYTNFNPHFMKTEY